MGDEWREAKIEEIAARVAMGPFGSSIKVETFVPSGVPVISGQHLRGTKVDDGVGFNFVSEAHADRLRNANVQRGDIIFTHAGNIGQVAYVPMSSQFDRYVISQRQFYMRCDRRKAIPEFVVAYFKTPEGQHQLLANTSQVGVPSIAQPVTYLRTIEIPLPPLAVQRAIAHILGTLDDKIELNRRISETLEAIARALFKSWFVDFDPVRAKMEGRWRRGQSLPGLPAHLYDIFPDRLVDSELGQTPEGWPIECLGDHVDGERGLSYKGEGLRDDGSGLPMHNLNSIYEGGGYKHEGIKFYAGAYREKHILAPGDLIMTNTEQGFDHLLIGHAAIVPEAYGPRGLYSHHIFRIRMKSGSPFTPHYLVRLFNHPRWHQLISGFSNGTTINMLPADTLVIPRIVVPPARLIDVFSRMASDVHARVEASRAESLTLASQRDASLPRLVSGELRVPEANRLVEEVA